MRASEWILLAACVGLLVVGPAMSLQELAHEEEARAEAEQRAAREKLTGTDEPDPPPDASFRGAWRLPLFGLVAVAGVAGSLLAVRVARRKRWRAVGGRLLGLLLVGMTVLDLAFLLDVRWAFGTPFTVRAWSVVWLYPLGAMLVAGALYRLTELEPLFGSDELPAPALGGLVVVGDGRSW